VEEWVEKERRGKGRENFAEDTHAQTITPLNIKEGKCKH
jgi:hypothetical protein